MIFFPSLINICWIYFLRLFERRKKKRNGGSCRCKCEREIRQDGLDVVDPAPFCSALLATAQVDRIDMQITPTGLSLSLSLLPSLPPPFLPPPRPSAPPPCAPISVWGRVFQLDPFSLASFCSFQGFLDGFFLFAVGSSGGGYFRLGPARWRLLAGFFGIFCDSLGF